MNFLEKNLEDIIFNTENEKITERGLYICGKKLRQVRIGNYGVCDLITFRRIGSGHDSGILINLFELKKDFINEETFFQSIRYLKGIKSYIESRFPDWDVRYSIKLIGSTYNKSGAFIYLPDIINIISIYTYEYDFDGITFKSHSNYSLREEGFNG